jgi:hypothetical protein
MPVDAKVPYEKKARDHLAKQGLMKERITDALKKQQGGNCSRSYASLAKVISASILLEKISMVTNV